MMAEFLGHCNFKFHIIVLINFQIANAKSDTVAIHSLAAATNIVIGLTNSRRKSLTLQKKSETLPLHSLNSTETNELHSTEPHSMPVAVNKSNEYLKLRYKSYHLALKDPFGECLKF